jgi:predicted TIM-barrel fold metal-dependent hydrolase
MEPKSTVLPGPAKRSNRLNELWVADVDVHLNEDPVAMANYAESRWRDSFLELRHATARYLDIPGFSVAWGAIDPPIPGRHADGDPIAGHPDWETRAVKTAQQMRDELDALSINVALLIPDHLLTLAALPNPRWACAIARAYNRWMIAEWLEATHGLYGAIVAPPHDLEQAVAEIRRHADHPKVAAIYLPTACISPLWGHQMYDPIYAAAQDANLPVVLHSVGIVHPNFPHNMHGIETEAARHALMHPLGMMANLVSMIGTGVPARFPKLNVVFTESGISWVPFIAWKLDKEYTERRREFPFYPEPPSHYVKKFFYSTQPIEEPPDPKALVQLMEMLSLSDQVLFSSDWPHHDFDHPSHCLKLPLDSDSLAKMMGGNAQRLFGFSKERASE